MMKKIYTLAIVLLVLGVSSCKLALLPARTPLAGTDRRNGARFGFGR